MHALFDSQDARITRSIDLLDNNIIPTHPLSHPTRSSPLPHMHEITDTYDTVPFRNAVTPEASLSGPSWVLPSPELHQNFEWNDLIPHSCRRINIGKLKAITFVSGPQCCYRIIIF